MLLDERLPIHVFSSASEALTFINNQASIFDNLKGFTDYTLLDNSDQKICLNIDTLHQQIYNSERFAQISIVITDYAMPEMDGLDFLRQIKHSEIKRILLTGVADEKTAVKAFNEGLIDRFFLKNAANLDWEINQVIEELQESYFALLGYPINHALLNYTGTFLTDPRFQKLFSKLRSEHDWVEYYILEQPQGILLLNSSGETSYLFISSEEEMRSRYEMAAAGYAPAKLLQILAEGKHVSWFPTDDGFYAAYSSIENWQDCLYPINFFYGTNNKNHCALVTPSPLQKIDISKIGSYQDYLDNFDKKTLAEINTS